jgi:histidinol-phosphate aminotransferase
MRRVLPHTRRSLVLSDLYPESGAELRRALAERNGLTAGSVLLGQGATDVLDLIVRTFVCPGDEVISAEPGFPWYQMLGQLNGAQNVIVPLRDHMHDLETMARRITARTKLVFVAHPNNSTGPTGATITSAALDAFVARLPDHVILVLDEADADAGEEDDAARSLPYLAHKHVIVVRTFSKIAGLAGPRIGYAIARPEIVALLQKVQAPSSSPTLAHGSIRTSLTRTASRATPCAGKDLLYAELARLKLRFIPSQSNFIFVDFETSVEPIAYELLRRGFAILPMLETCARITVGPLAQTAAFVRALEDVLRSRERRGAIVRGLPEPTRASQSGQYPVP